MSRVTVWAANALFLQQRFEPLTMGLFSRCSLHRGLRMVPISVFAALLLGGAGTNAESQTQLPAAMPEFANQSAQGWINSPPIRQATLRGQVVLLDVFAAG